jgi:hypothetical protein
MMNVLITSMNQLVRPNGALVKAWGKLAEKPTLERSKTTFCGDI